MRPSEQAGSLLRLRGGEAAVAKDEDEDTAHDARTLAIRATTVGRHRDFGTLDEQCGEEIFDDFPLVGPYTAGCRLQFFRRRRCPPITA